MPAPAQSDAKPAKKHAKAESGRRAKPASVAKPAEA